MIEEIAAARNPHSRHCSYRPLQTCRRQAPTWPRTAASENRKPGNNRCRRPRRLGLAGAGADGDLARRPPAKPPRRSIRQLYFTLKPQLLQTTAAIFTSCDVLFLRPPGKLPFQLCMNDIPTPSRRVRRLARPIARRRPVTPPYQYKRLLLPCCGLPPQNVAFLLHSPWLDTQPRSGDGPSRALACRVYYRL